MEISGQTRLFGLVGDPVAQARSPSLFNDLFERSSVDAACVAFEVKDGDLAAFFAGAKTVGNIDGLFITTPHKRGIAPLLDGLTPTSQSLNSVNVARRERDGRWRGAMFDGLGCVLGLRSAGIDLNGRRVLVLGCGGAGRAIGLALAMADAKSITLLDKDPSASTSLADLIKADYPATAVATEMVSDTGHDVFINASTLGMKAGDPSPFPSDWLSPGSVVVDLVTEPNGSPLGEVVRIASCKMFGGSLVHQGQAVFAAQYVGLEYWPANWEPVNFDDLLDFDRDTE